MNSEHGSPTSQPRFAIRSEPIKPFASSAALLLPFALLPPASSEALLKRSAPFAFYPFTSRLKRSAPSPFALGPMPLSPQAKRSSSLALLKRSDRSP